jgi:hypothetical protein
MDHLPLSASNAINFSATSAFFVDVNDEYFDFDEESLDELSDEDFDYPLQKKVDTVRKSNYGFLGVPSDFSVIDDGTGFSRMTNPMGMCGYITEDEIQENLEYLKEIENHFGRCTTSFTMLSMEKVSEFRKTGAIEDPIVKYQINPMEKEDPWRYPIPDETKGRTVAAIFSGMYDRHDQISKKGINPKYNILAATSDIYEFVDRVDLSYVPSIEHMNRDEVALSLMFKKLRGGVYKEINARINSGEFSSITLIDNGNSTEHQTYGQKYITPCYVKYTGLLSDYRMSVLRNYNKEAITIHEIEENVKGSVSCASYPQGIRKEDFPNGGFVIIQSSPEEYNVSKGVVYPSRDAAKKVLYNAKDCKRLKDHTGFVRFKGSDGVVKRLTWTQHKDWTDLDMTSILKQAKENGLIPMYRVPSSFLPTHFLDKKLLDDTYYVFWLQPIDKIDEQEGIEDISPSVISSYKYVLPGSVHKLHFTEVQKQYGRICLEVDHYFILLNGSMYLLDIDIDLPFRKRLKKMEEKFVTISYSELPICSGNICIGESTFLGVHTHEWGEQESLPGFIIPGKTPVLMEGPVVYDVDRRLEVNIAYNSIIKSFVYTKEVKKIYIFPFSNSEHDLGERIGHFGLVNLYKHSAGLLLGSNVLVPYSSSKHLIDERGYQFLSNLVGVTMDDDLIFESDDIADSVVEHTIVNDKQYWSYKKIISMDFSIFREKFNSVMKELMEQARLGCSPSEIYGRRIFVEYEPDEKDHF